MPGSQSNSSEPLSVTITAFLDGVQVGSFTQLIHTGAGGGPTFVDFSSFGVVDELTFDTPTGANSLYFGFDDVQVFGHRNDDRQCHYWR